MQSEYIHLTEYQSGQLLNTHEKKHDCLTLSRIAEKPRKKSHYTAEV